MTAVFEAELPLGPGEGITFPREPSDASGVLRIRTDDGTEIYVPFPADGAKAFSFSARRACRVAPLRTERVEKIGRLPALAMLGKAAIKRDPRVRLLHGTLVLHAEDAAARKRIRKELKILDLLDLRPESFHPEDGPELVLGLEHMREPSTPRCGLRTAVSVHLHYPDAWPDIAAALSHLPRPFGLFVTATDEAAVLEADIRAEHPFAEFMRVPNAGRDVRPFIALLERDSFDGYDIVCKLHGKKSLREGRPTLLGELWRRAALLDLVAGRDNLRDVFALFSEHPDVGIVGPARFRLPKDAFGEHDAWSGNRDETLRIAETIGIDAADFKLDFFAGTMFWFRPEALAPLRGKGFGAIEAYSTEAGKIDGAVEHALERLFSAATRAAGFESKALKPGAFLRR